MEVYNRDCTHWVTTGLSLLVDAGCKYLSSQKLEKKKGPAAGLEKKVLLVQHPASTQTSQVPQWEARKLSSIHDLQQVVFNPILPLILEAAYLHHG